jgi:hypothetical protein
MGRQRIEIDIEEFEKLCRLHCTQEELAAWFNCGINTIRDRVAKRKEYRDAWNRGRAAGRVSLRRAQFAAALNGDRTMMVWMGKQLLDQKDSVKETKSLIRVQDARKSLVDEITEYLVTHGSPETGEKAGRGEE